MDLELEIGTSLCYASTFIINGINADTNDFGEQYDASPDEAEPYGCGNMTFYPRRAAPEILNKYNITLEEYNEICGKLEDGLSFGSCGWCI